VKAFFCSTTEARALIHSKTAILRYIGIEHADLLHGSGGIPFPSNRAKRSKRNYYGPWGSKKEETKKNPDWENAKEERKKSRIETIEKERKEQETNC
jgi:hypothetical protein